MAKKQKKEKIDDTEQLEKEKSGSKLLTVLIALLIVIVWLVVFIFLIKLDVGGFGSNVLRPVLKDIPIINKILPNVSDEQLAEENDYPYKNITEAIEKIKELEAEVADLQKNGAVSSDYVEELEAEVSRLKVFEDAQKEFEDRVAEFDRNVVFAENAPDIEEYKNYYEEIEPENAEEIYRQTIEQIAIDQKVIDQGKMYAAMEPSEAAPILEVLAEGDVDLVSNILNSMKTTKSGPILAAMDSVKAARISKRMSVID